MKTLKCHMMKIIKLEISVLKLEIIFCRYYVFKPALFHDLEVECQKRPSVKAYKDCIILYISL